MKFTLRQLRALFAALVLCAAVSSPARAQRIVVVTEARNALGESAQLTAHSADFGTADVLPGGLVLPGTGLVGPLVLDAAHRGVMASSGQVKRGIAMDARHEESALIALRAAPFDLWPDATDATLSGWRTWAVDVVEDPKTLSYLLVSAAAQFDHGVAWRGRLDTRPWPPEGTPGRVQSPGGMIPLNLAPKFVFSLQTGACVALGSAEEGGPVVLQRANPTLGTTETPVALADGSHLAGHRHLAAAVLAPEENTLWVLFSSLDLQDSGVEPRSWLYAIDLQSLSAQGPPLAISGVAATGFQTLTASLGGQCWVATRTPGSDFGQVTKATLDEAVAAAGPIQAQSWSIVGIQERLSIAAQTVSGDLLAAIDGRLEFWPKGERKGAAYAYDAPITMLRWSDSGLIVGEGNRLHRVSLPEVAVEATIDFQSGWVSDFVVLPAALLPQPDTDADGIEDATERRQQTKPDNSDSDGDGIPDGSDPFPSAPSPQLKVGAEVLIPYTAVGRQLRALQIESLGAPDAQWQIDFDAEELPWLRVHPRNFRGTGQAYLGVDPERFDPAGVTSGTLQVTLSGKPKGNRPGYAAAYSPSTVHIRVEPPRDPLRTILWLWPAGDEVPGFRDASDPRGLRDLGDLAAGFPYYFSHVEHVGPIAGALDRYSIVVIGARAAAEGVLTQKALFDYLSDGGAVLFLGEHLEGERFRDLGAWLAPLGVSVNMDTALNGSFPADTRQELLRHMPALTIEQGCRITSRTAEGVTVSANGDDSPGGRDLAFLARSHGYGRIALLAAPTPLEGTALAQAEGRDFALDLLYWLSRAGYAVDDRDGDGLLDATEDWNDNGAVDDGETNWLDPDTDGDGIPDGLEDTNRNGVVDKGETDPRLKDTDGDGVDDGADSTPVG